MGHKSRRALLALLLQSTAQLLTRPGLWLSSPCQHSQAGQGPSRSGQGDGASKVPVSPFGEMSHLEVRMCSSWAGVGFSTLAQIVQTCGMPENPDPPHLRLGWGWFLTLPLREHTPGVSHFPQAVSIVPCVLMGCNGAPWDLGHCWGCAAGAGSISDLTGR